MWAHCKVSQAFIVSHWSFKCHSFLKHFQVRCVIYFISLFLHLLGWAQIELIGGCTECLKKCFKSKYRWAAAKLSKVTYQELSGVQTKQKCPAWLEHNFTQTNKADVCSEANVQIKDGSISCCSCGAAPTLFARQQQTKRDFLISWTGITMREVWAWMVMVKLLSKNMQWKTMLPFVLQIIIGCTFFLPVKLSYEKAKTLLLKYRFIFIFLHTNIFFFLKKINGWEEWINTSAL